MIRKPASRTRTIHPVVQTVRTTVYVANQTSAAVKRTGKRAGRLYATCLFYIFLFGSGMSALTTDGIGPKIFGALFTLGLYKAGRYLLNRTA